MARPVPPDHLRCTAKVRNGERKGERCTQHRSEGSKVCHMHGGVSRKRAASGKRKNPATVNTKHGRYARRTLPDLGAAVAGYQKTGEALFDLDTLAARTWVLLEQVDRDSDAVAGMVNQLLPLANDAATPAEAAEVTAALLNVQQRATQTHAIVEQVVRRLESLASTRARIAKDQGVVSQAEYLATLRVLVTWVRELQSDSRVPREELADRLLERLAAFGQGQASIIPEQPAESVQ